MKPILKINFRGIVILLVASLISLGASLILSFYERTLGSYLTSIVLLVCSFHFLILTIQYAKGGGSVGEPMLKSNFVGIMSVFFLFLFGVSLVLSFYKRTFGYYLINIVLFLLSVIFFTKAFKQVKKGSK